jgi:hypothetical protein
METTSSQVLKSWQSSSVNHIWAAAATTNKNVQRQRHRQVREGVDGGRLEEDGDNIESSHQVMVIEQCELHLGVGCNNEQDRATATRPAGP